VDAFFIAPLHDVITLNRGMRKTMWVQRAEKKDALAEEKPDNYWNYEKAWHGWMKAEKLAGLEGKIKEKQTYSGNANIAHKKWLNALAKFEADIAWRATDVELFHTNERIWKILEKKLSPEDAIKLCNEAINANLSPKMKIAFYLYLAEAYSARGEREDFLKKESALLEVKRLLKKIEQDMGGKLEK